jgi:stage III sporulation protein AA
MEVDMPAKERLQELRLRINAPPELVISGKSRWLSRAAAKDDLTWIVNAASRYSPWAAATISRGFLTSPGGHRIGICGQAIAESGRIRGVRSASSICIRIARDFPGISAPLTNQKGSVLILGSPGSGKTTLLRDLIRQLEEKEKISVVDERGELFPEGLPRGTRLDVLSGCAKAAGIPMLLRTMGPTCIGVDEITNPEDTAALLQAANCGVRLLATAHGVCISDLRMRSVYRPLWENRIFDVILILKKDKSYTMERMTEWVTSGSVQY